MKLAILWAALFGATLGSAAAQALVNLNVDYGQTANLVFSNAVSTTTGNFNPNNPTETDTALSTAWGALSIAGLSTPFSAGAAQGGSSVVQGGWAVISNGVPPGPTNTGKYTRLDQTYKVGSTVDGFRLTVSDNATGNSGLNNTISTSFAIYENKADFLNGFASVSNLTLQGLSFSINVPNLPVKTGSSNVYALIENGTQWYVSGISISAASSSPSSFNLASQTWYAYDPANLLFNAANPGVGVSGSTFNDIQAAGAFAQTVDADDSGANNQSGTIAVWTELAGLQITMVPEPSSLLLFGFAVVLLALAAIARRRVEA